MRTQFRLVPSLVAAAVAMVLAGTVAAEPRVVSDVVEAGKQTEHTQVRVTRLVEGLEHPWALAFLPDGRKLVGERPGRLNLIDGDRITRLEGLPEIDTDEDQLSAPEGGNQGGLLDVVVHPDFASNGWIYFTYSSPGDNDSVIGDDEYGTTTALARARLDADNGRLTDVETLYAAMPRHTPGRHYGSRIVFPGDGTVVFSIGDRGLRWPSGDLGDPAGSMIRLNEDGSIPEGNPFIGQAPGNLRPEIWSWGHRNNQGLAVHPATGEIWTSEHGPSGGDLVHRIERGANYGWPHKAYGVEYSTGEAIGLRGEVPGVTPPVHVWEDSMAPSGLTFVSGSAFEPWEGNLIAGSLLRKQLHRLVIEDGAVTHEEVLLTGSIGRIRDVRQGPDGNLYVLTDEGDGGLYRLEPAS